MEEENEKVAIVGKALDYLAKYCEDNEILLQGVIVFTVGDESFVEHILPANL